MVTKNKFNEKGEVAEQLIAALCKDAFFEDFCFKNPFYAPGKELCDVLVTLGEVAIIWQIKNIKLKDGQFNNSDIEKAIKQSRGARRRLLDLGTVTFKNIAGKDKVIDTSKIKEVFLIAAIEGGTPYSSQYYDNENKGNGNVHIFLESLTQFATKHLNTVTDFVEYLRYKEKFLKKHKNIIINDGEENLLALYLQNNRTFGNMEDAKDVDMMMIDLEGAADELENDQDYREKLEADKWSEGWDMLIEKKREGTLPDGSIPGPENDSFLAKMMSHNRFERRVLSRTFFDAGMKALEGPNRESWMYRRIVPHDGVTYVFSFIGSGEMDRDKRRVLLHNIALAARQVVPTNDMVIGIATEREMIKSPTASFDWVMLDITNEDFEKAYGDPVREFREKTGIWNNTTVTQATSWEYPSDARKKQSQTKNKKRSKRTKRNV